MRRCFHGVLSTRAYDLQRGTLDSIQTRDASGVLLQGFTYSFDAMGRPNRLVRRQWTSPTEWLDTEIVNNVLYGPAGELTQMQYRYDTG